MGKADQERMATGKARAPVGWGATRTVPGGIATGAAAATPAQRKPLSLTKPVERKPLNLAPTKKTEEEPKKEEKKTETEVNPAAEAAAPEPAAPVADVAPAEAPV